MKLLTFKKIFKSLVGAIAQMDQLCSLRLVTEVRYFQKYEAFIGELCYRRPASYEYGASGRAFGHPPKPGRREFGQEFGRAGGRACG